VTNTTGGQNTAVGLNSLLLNTEGSYNSALGIQALNSNTTGSKNTAVGYQSLYANTTADNNTAVGSASLSANTTGTDLAAVGRNALTANTEGVGNTAIGDQAGYNTTTGDYNTFLGKSAHADAAGNDNCNVIGYNVSGASGYTTLGITTDDIRAAHGVATWATVSDERYKKDIVDSTAGLSFINALQPRTFKYKTLGELPETFSAYEEGSTKVFKNANTNHGFIAQEIKAAIDADDSIKDGFRLWDDREDGSQEVAEAALIPVLVKAIQELSAQNDALTTRITALEG
jgi:trimeric autotransporter adhesin